MNQLPIVEIQLEEILKTEKKDDSFRKIIDEYAGSIKREKRLDIDEERGKYLKKIWYEMLFWKLICRLHKRKYKL